MNNKSFENQYYPHWINMVITALVSLFLITVALYVELKKNAKTQNWNIYFTVAFICIAIFILRNLFISIQCDDNGIGLFVFKKKRVHIDYLEIRSITKNGFPIPSFVIYYMRGFKNKILIIPPLNRSKEFINNVKNQNSGIVIRYL